MHESEKYQEFFVPCHMSTERRGTTLLDTKKSAAKPRREFRKSLVETHARNPIDSPGVFYGAVCTFTFAPILGNKTDPCFVGEGTVRLYAWKYKIGAAAFNFDTTNDLSETVLSKTDRSTVVGTALPSGVMITVAGGTPTASIGMGGGVYTPQLPNTCFLVRIHW